MQAITTTHSALVHGAFHDLMSLLTYVWFELAAPANRLTYLWGLAVATWQKTDVICMIHSEKSLDALYRFEIGKHLNLAHHLLSC